jgi:hypothetical protein
VTIGAEHERLSAEGCGVTALQVAPVETEVTLVWERFASFRAARRAYATRPCVYVTTDRRGCPIRVGMTTMGLRRRYPGGTAYQVEAMGHRSGNGLYVAEVDADVVPLVEHHLIYMHRDSLP